MKKVSFDFSRRVLFCAAFCTFSGASTMAAPVGTDNLSDADVVQIVAQTGKTIKGVVTDNFGPVLGANVLVKGTTNGVITDMDGKFTLSNVPEGAVLQVSFIGYVTREIKVAGQTTFNIQLSEDAKALEEVVVVGYGSQKKVNLTGAVGQIDSKVLESRPITSTASALQGTIPNLQITNISGEPGQSASLNVRGTTSINGGSPLVLVDGVEMSLDLVNPNDIANVTVLKDAAASAIYGVRAAFGVVLVTTKSPQKAEKVTVNYTGNISFAKPSIMPEFIESQSQFAEWMNQACINGSTATKYKQETIDKMKAYEADPVHNPEYEVIDGQLYYYGYSDFREKMVKNVAPTQRHNLNISGGNEKTRFYTSVGYLSQDGLYKVGDDNFKRLNTDPDATGIGWNAHGGGLYRLPEALHPTAWTGQMACEMIHNYDKGSGEPLFLKVSFARPHSPYDPPQRLMEKYRGKKVPAPAVGEWCKNKKYAVPCDVTTADKDAAFGNFGEEYAKESRRYYYANVTFVDEEIGKVVRALKEKGMYDNALICYVSDHGDMLGDHHHWRKTYPYEGSTHVPYIVKWPAACSFEKGGKVEAPVELRDLLPTFLDMAGGKVPEDMDGRSLTALVKGGNCEWRKYIDLEHSTCYSPDNYWCALTDGKIKYVWRFHTGEEELFDLAKDPQELKNVAKEKKYAAKLREMRGEMVKHLAERGEEFVKDGQLQVLKRTVLYSPLFPDENPVDTGI